MTKQEALEKALEWLVDHWLVDKVVETSPYTPPREAPPKGTIVEVWGDGATAKIVGYSTGRVIDGFLEVQVASCFGREIHNGNNWRVVGGETLPTLDEYGDCGWYEACKNSTDEQKCKECKQTRPSNFEGVE